jgi:hypothetical protein
MYSDEIWCRMRHLLIANLFFGFFRFGLVLTALSLFDPFLSLFVHLCSSLLHLFPPLLHFFLPLFHLFFLFLSKSVFAIIASNRNASFVVTIYLSMFLGTLFMLSISLHLFLFMFICCLSSLLSHLLELSYLLLMLLDFFFSFFLC